MSEKIIRKTIINSIPKRITFLSSQLTLHEYRNLVEYASTLIPKKAKVLDIGCGIGYSTSYLSHLRKDAEIIGLDPFKIDSWKTLSEKFKTKIIKADGLKLPIKTGTIDFVLSFGVIEHVENDIKFLEEINRVLKPGSKNVIFHIPNKYALNEFLAKHIGMGHHDLKYTPEEIKERLNKTGFRMVSWSYDYLLPLQFYKISKRLNKSLSKRYKSIHSLDKILIKTPLKNIAESFSVVSEKIN